MVYSSPSQLAPSLFSSCAGIIELQDDCVFGPRCIWNSRTWTTPFVVLYAKRWRSPESTVAPLRDRNARYFRTFHVPDWSNPTGSSPARTDTVRLCPSRSGLAGRVQVERKHVRVRKGTASVLKGRRRKGRRFIGHETTTSRFQRHWP